MDPPASADFPTPTPPAAAAAAPTPAAEPPDEETILAARKRSRRVSFAETTAVHVFVRDDDSDSPFASSSSADTSSQHGSSSAASPDSSSGDANASPPSSSSDDDADPVLLFRDIDSSSPGSALGSITSNDDDNFFGPVSASFIRSGRHSETEASEDNNNHHDHDITLDSTAFSLHYRNLADDRSVGSVRTPTVETVGSSSGGVSVSESRNAMSLVEEDSKRYDYGKISPALEALLAEVDQSLEPSSPGVVKESGDGEGCGGDDFLMEDSADQDGGLNPSQVNTQGNLIIEACANDKAQDTGHTVVDDYIKYDRKAAQYDVVTANSQNLNLLSPPYKKPVELHFHSDNINQSCVKDEGNLGRCYPMISPLAPEFAIIGSQQQLELECAVRTPTNYVHAFHIPMHGSVSSIHAKRQKLYHKESSSPLEMEFRKHDEKISAIKNQITRFKILETPVLTNFQAALSLEDNMLLDLEGTPSKIADVPNTEHIGIRDNNCEDKLINTAESPRANQMFNLKQSGFDTPNEESRTIKETNRAQNSLRLPKTVSDISGHHVECENEEIDVGGQTTMIHPSDIIFKVSEATKELFSTSVYMLTLEKIDMLESLLSELQRARKYERFCVSLSNIGHLSDAHQKRISEARLLQDKLLFEQLKLQLKRVKLHLLHNKAQLYQSRYEECQRLKSMLSRLICRTGASQTHETNLYSDSIHSSDTNQEVASKKQELEMLGQKIKCLLKPFEASCNIRGDMAINQIIEVLNENLEMRKRCRIIRQDLQLWELSDVVKKNDCSEFVLNYCNLLCQRFTINVGQVSSISSNNMLNESKIEKNFPKMNAQLAFGFVFNVKGAQRLADSNCFQHKTLVTSLLLGTLLDVIKEVEVSRRELWNLVSSSFYSQCSGQLELHLCFFNFKSCGKVTLALDVTCLDCGVYPSKSSELQVRIILGSETTLPQSILDEITSTISSLQDGRPVIWKLCRRISELVQPSS